MSNLNLNKVVLAGRLTADPEMKQTTSGIHVCRFTLAVNRRYQQKNADGSPAGQQADFISIVAWRQTAEFICRYFRRGSAICICGSIQTRSWKDGSGATRYATEIVADEALFVGVKTDDGGEIAPQGDPSGLPGHSSAVPSVIADISVPDFAATYDEDVPF